MLANKHLYEEIEALEKQCEQFGDYEKAMLKTQILILKLLHNIRTNQVSTMTSKGIGLIKTNKKEVPDGKE